MHSRNAVVSGQPAISTDRRLTVSIIVLLAGLSAISTLSTNIILPAFPAIAGDLGVSPRDLGLTLSSFFVVFALGQLVVGPLADRYGRKWLVLGGLTIFIAGTVLCGYAASLDVLIAGRIVQAVGVCAASVLARAIVRDLFEGETLARALSLTMIAMAAAPGFSPLVGGVMSTAFGWRAIFIFVGVAAAGIALFYGFGLAETHPEDRRAPHSAWNIVAAYGRLARDRRFILPAIAVGLLLGGLFASFAAAPAILISGIGLSPVQAGLFFAATVFVVFGAGIAAPRLAHRFGARTIATLGFIFAICGGALLLIGSNSPSLAWYATSMVLFLWGMGLANPLVTAIALNPFGAQAGLASALIGFLQMGSAAVLIWLGTAVPFAPVTTLGFIQAGGCMIALAAFAFQER